MSRRRPTTPSVSSSPRLPRWPRDEQQLLRRRGAVNDDTALWGRADIDLFLRRDRPGDELDDPRYRISRPPMTRTGASSASTARSATLNVTHYTYNVLGEQTSTDDAGRAGHVIHVRPGREQVDRDRPGRTDDPLHLRRRQPGHRRSAIPAERRRRRSATATTLTVSGSA